MASNAAVGRGGEDAAARWYENAGFAVLARNWRVRAGELDLVCARGSTVVFCEVKTRTSARFGHGVEAVDARKQQRIRRLAVQWLQACGEGYAEVRFDVAQVDGRHNVEVWEGCF